MADNTTPEKNDQENKGGGKLLFLLKAVTPIVILMMGFSAYGYLKSSKPPPKKPKQVEKTWPVKTLMAKQNNITPTLTLYGKTVSRRQVELRALVSGKIIKTGQSLKEGAFVKRGEMLLEIDDFDYQGALREATAFLDEAKARQAELEASIRLEQENLKYAQTQLSLAKKDFQRASDLSKRGTVTKKLADDRKVIVSQRQQSVATFRINLDLQQARLKGQVATVERLKWKVDQAKRRLEETQLLAPFDAYVSTVNAEIGRTVSINDKIANLIDVNEIDVRFVISNAQYGRILSYENTVIGRKVDVIWKVGDQPQTFKATIKRKGAEISSQTGGVEVYAALDNPKKAATIRTGAFVEIRIKDREYKNVYKLPQTAIYDGNKIFLIKNGRLKSRDVTIVGTDESDVLIRSDLPEGAQILGSRLTLAGDGVKVRSTNNGDNKRDKKTVSSRGESTNQKKIDKKQSAQTN